MQTMQQPEIVSIHPWIDLMPGLFDSNNAIQLMCAIEFNMQITQPMIERILLINGNNDMYTHDISEVGFKFEIRGNKIIIRCGPQWDNISVTANVDLHIDGTYFRLCSQPTPITHAH